MLKHTLFHISPSAVAGDHNEPRPLGLVLLKVLTGPWSCNTDDGHGGCKGFLQGDAAVCVIASRDGYGGGRQLEENVGYEGYNPLRETETYG